MSKIKEKTLKTKKKTLRQERDEYLLGWKRALADYENLKKQVSNDRSRLKTIFTSDIIASLLPVYDNLEVAVANTPDVPEAREWFEGVKFVKKQFTDIISSLGVMNMEVVGKKFDPKFHEAVGEASDDSLEDGIIISQTQAGFTMNEDLVRPAKVIVNKLDN